MHNASETQTAPTAADLALLHYLADLEQLGEGETLTADAPIAILTGVGDPNPNANEAQFEAEIEEVASEYRAIRDRCDGRAYSLFFAEVALDASDVNPEGYAEYRVTVELPQGTIVRDCWARCGYVRAGAHQDLDGSGLRLWGDSQPGQWRDLDSDGQARGTDELRKALEASGLDLDVDAIIEQVEQVRPRVAEPTDDDLIAYGPDLRPRSWAWASLFDVPVLFVAGGGKIEAYRDPSAREIRRLFEAVADAVVEARPEE